MKNKINLHLHDLSITQRQDGSGNPEGITILEQFFSETFVDEVLIPGLTVSQIDFAKNGKYIFKEIVGAAAQVIDLCATATPGGTPTVIHHEFPVDKRVFADLSGCYLTNITDVYYDEALWEETKLQIKIALNAYFLQTLDASNVIVSSPVALTADNVFTELNRAKGEYRRSTGKAATVMIADYSMEELIKAKALMVPNSSQVDLVNAPSVDFYNGLVIRYADLQTDVDPLNHVNFYLTRADFNAFGVIDPDENSALPGHSEEMVEEGFIIRRTESHLELERKTSVNLPFGLKILKPTYVYQYPKL